MTQLLSSAFDYTLAEATRLKSTSGRARGAVILLVDEADALAQSREAVQMHHAFVYKLFMKQIVILLVMK